MLIENKILEIAFAPEIVYFPTNKNHPGGLFNKNFKAIPQAMSRRGNQVVLSRAINADIGDFDSLPLIESDVPYFFIGLINHHYGHFLLESTTRLWFFLYFQQLFAGKILYCGHSSVLMNKSFVKDVLGSFALNQKDFIAYKEPCRLKNVFIAPPTFEIRLRAHPAFRQTMEHVGNALVNDLAEINNTNSTPLYLSKSKLKGWIRRISNEQAIEESLRKQGVDIYHPECFDLPTQIKELASRKYVLGSVGSALHTLLFCPGNKVISAVMLGNGISPPSYVAIDKLCGNLAHYEPCANMGIIQEAKTDQEVKFNNNFYATDPEQVAKMLLHNIN